MFYKERFVLFVISFFIYIWNSIQTFGSAGIFCASSYVSHTSCFPTKITGNLFSSVQLAKIVLTFPSALQFFGSNFCFDRSPSMNFSSKNLFTFGVNTVFVFVGGNAQPSFHVFWTVTCCFILHEHLGTPMQM